MFQWTAMADCCVISVGDFLFLSSLLYSVVSINYITVNCFVVNEAFGDSISLKSQPTNNYTTPNNPNLYTKTPPHKIAYDQLLPLAMPYVVILLAKCFMVNSVDYANCCVLALSLILLHQ